MKDDQVRILDMLKALVRFDTVSSKPNRALIDWVADYLDGFGIPVAVVPSDDGAKANLYATVGPTDHAGGVVLSGHTDVVPVVGQAWSSDPFALTQRDGRLHGRGTSDMKGFLAAALAMAPAWRSRPLACPIHIALTYDEEVGCFGAPRLIDHMLTHLPRPKTVIVGEPTSMMPANANKGILVFDTRIEGRHAHSGKPAIGASAVRYGVAIAERLWQLSDRCRAHPDPASGFDPPYTTLNVGVIEGGSAFNIVARDCRLEWDIRPIPGDDPAAMVAEIEAFIADDLLPRLKSECPAGGIVNHARCEVPPLVPDPNGMAERLVAGLTGANAAGTVPFATEAGLYQRAGLSAVVIGPGDVAQAHQPDEFIESDKLWACADFLGRVAHWAETPPQADR